MKKHKTLVGIFGGVIAVILLMWWGWWSFNTYDTANRNAEIASKLAKAASVAPAVPVATAAPASTTPTTPATTVSTTPAPAAPTGPAVKMVAAKEVPESLKLAIVGKGEGIEHALIRQLIAVPEIYGFKGDASDKNAVKKWAGKRAHQLAILAGYVNAETGEEVRVKGSGGNIAYLLTEKGVEEYTVGDDGNFKDTPGETHELAQDFGSAQFEGDDIDSYEYFFFPFQP